MRCFYVFEGIEIKLITLLYSTAYKFVLRLCSLFTIYKSHIILKIKLYFNLRITAIFKILPYFVIKFMICFLGFWSPLDIMQCMGVGNLAGIWAHIVCVVLKFPVGRHRTPNLVRLLEIVGVVFELEIEGVVEIQKISHYGHIVQLVVFPFIRQTNGRVYKYSIISCAPIVGCNQQTFTLYTFTLLFRWIINSSTKSYIMF